MLKLEKITKTLEISIILRPRSSLFTKSFKKAFLIALSLHILIGVIFTVESISLLDNLRDYSPVYVESEGPGIINNQAIANLEKEEIYFRYIGEPPEAKPEIPKGKFHDVGGYVLAGQKFESLPHNPFLRSENWIMSPSIPLAESSRHSLDAIHIIISGGLENFSLLSKGWNDEDFLHIKKMKLDQYSQSFQVRLDLQTGEIFWYEPLSLSKSKKWELFAEHLLTKIQFEPTVSSEFIASGIIDISIVKPEEE